MHKDNFGKPKRLNQEQLESIRLYGYVWFLCSDFYHFDFCFVLVFVARQCLMNVVIEVWCSFGEQVSNYSFITIFLCITLISTCYRKERFDFQIYFGFISIYLQLHLFRCKWIIILVFFHVHTSIEIFLIVSVFLQL